MLRCALHDSLDSSKNIYCPHSLSQTAKIVGHCRDATLRIPGTAPCNRRATPRREGSRLYPKSAFPFLAPAHAARAAEVPPACLPPAACHLLLDIGMRQALACHSPVASGIRKALGCHSLLASGIKQELGYHSLLASGIKQGVGMPLATSEWHAAGIGMPSYNLRWHAAGVGVPH